MSSKNGERTTRQSGKATGEARDREVTHPPLPGSYEGWRGQGLRGILGWHKVFRELVVVRIGHWGDAVAALGKAAAAVRRA